MDEYWKNRTLASEAKAAKLAASYSKRQEQFYKRAYKEITNELNAFYAAIEAGDILSRTQLWNYSRYQKILDIISSNCSAIGEHQINIMDAATEKIFKDTLENSLESLGKSNLFNTINFEDTMRVALNNAWSGNSYSKRVWNNTNALSTQLQKSIESMIAVGKNPNEIKAEIAKQFNTSYSVADRLIRTESSYVYNTAAIESYKQAGVEEVEFLAESDCCDECAKYRNKRFGIAEAPLIPVHPRCRCCYVPIV